MSNHIINGVEELKAMAGKDLGSTEWQTMEMARIRAFADATGDHQWIHVDEERARKESPYKAPIAHGYLTLSLVAGNFFKVVQVQGFKLTVNYGCNKVRFPNPLKANDRYRLTVKAGEVKQVNEWWETTFLATIEVEGQAKPACAAECIYRFLTP
jgi:acyl dehydratase